MIIVEPILGEAGVVTPPEGYLKQLRALCDQHGVLLVFDCVQTGMGRTGHWFGYEHENVRPDVITLAKGLGGGLPLGAMIALGDAAQLFVAGDHGSTFGGNPLSCAAALAAITEIVDGGLDKRAAELGDRIINNLKTELADTDHVLEIRGRGCMIGMELDKPCKSLFMAAMEKGLIINVTADSVIRLLPPFVMTSDQADQLVDILVPLIKDFDKD